MKDEQRLEAIASTHHIQDATSEAGELSDDTSCFDIDQSDDKVIARRSHETALAMQCQRRNSRWQSLRVNMGGAVKVKVLYSPKGKINDWPREPSEEGDLLISARQESIPRKTC